MTPEDAWTLAACALLAVGSLVAVVVAEVIDKWRKS